MYVLLPNRIVTHTLRPIVTERDCKDTQDKVAWIAWNNMINFIARQYIQFT